MIRISISDEGGGFDENELLRELAQDVAAELRSSAADLTCPVHASDGFVVVQVIENRIEIETCCSELMDLLPDV